MKRYQAINGFYLKSFGKLVYPQQILVAETEEEEAELDVFVKNGSCKELVTVKKEEKPEDVPPPPPGQDLADISGIGARTLEKLTAAGITTVDQLKEKLETEEVKEILGQNHEKVAKQITPTE